MQLLSKPEYEREIARTRPERMDWWRKARYGMFIHYGLYSQEGRNEWLQTLENIPVGEYEAYAKTFAPKPGCCREWAALAKRAGMKYMVLTTRHHEGFSLWNSKANPYNSMNACGRDIVREFVDACREFGLKIGFYSSLMDWHHPDGGICAYDTAARRRFLDYIEALNTELLTNYGKIDILWYDVPAPMANWEGWDSLERNQRLRALQPHIIINNRSQLDEDFSTPEEHITATDRDWEACMTFNRISWGYIDSEQARPYCYNAQQIINMLNTCASGAGNLLLNIGPKPDGSVPEEVVEPLETVGRWLAENGSAVYGSKKRINNAFRGNGVSKVTQDDNYVYVWNMIWPKNGTMGFGGWLEAPKSVSFMDGTPIDFEHVGHRIILKNLPAEAPDKTAGVTVLRFEYDHTPDYRFASYYPQLNAGEDIAGQAKL
ncbi:MAG: alpha-L-fucosidase [Clostridiales bacterium]|nr:alpha-L-fucosidase [Clostridiales bacterium]